MQTGTIARKTDRGYGFISVEGREKDLFFHASELNGVTYDELVEGDAVEFEEAEGQRGPQAVNVSRA